VSGDKLDLAGYLTDALEAQLAQAGSFEVRMAPLERGVDPDFVKSYPDADVDAYLDVVIKRAGYSAQYSSTPYVPTIYAPVRLVEARTGRVLYTTAIAITESSFVPKGSTQLEPDGHYAFSNFEALSSDRARAQEGLKVAAQQIAHQIATDLR